MEERNYNRAFSKGASKVFSACIGKQISIRYLSHAIFQHKTILNSAYNLKSTVRSYKQKCLLFPCSKNGILGYKERFKLNRLCFLEVQRPVLLSLLHQEKEENYFNFIIT